MRELRRPLVSSELGMRTEPIMLNDYEASLLTGRSVSWFRNRRSKGNGPNYYREPGTNRIFYLKNELLCWFTSSPAKSTADYNFAELQAHAAKARAAKKAKPPSA